MGYFTNHSFIKFQSIYLLIFFAIFTFSSVDTQVDKDRSLLTKITSPKNIPNAPNLKWPNSPLIEKGPAHDPLENGSSNPSAFQSIMKHGGNPTRHQPTREDKQSLKEGHRDTHDMNQNIDVPSPRNGVLLIPGIAGMEDRVVYLCMQMITLYQFTSQVPVYLQL